MPKIRHTPWTDLRDLLRFAKARLNEERLPQVAGSLTFTTALAVVPLLTIALAVFTAFPLFNTFRTSLEAYFIQSLMPKTIANTILGYLNMFSAKATRLSAVGAAVLILTAVAMMLTIDRALNQIWHVKVSRPIAQRIVVYWAIVTLGPLMIGVSLTATSYLFTATGGLAQRLPLFAPALYTLISVILTTAAFTLLYVGVPNRTVAWRDAAMGALFAAIAFEIAKRIFAMLIKQFPTYTVIYGALAAVPIFLIWVYLSWMIILMGGVIAAALPVVKYERWRHVPTPGSIFVDAMAILKVLVEARENGDTAAVDANRIRSRTRLGFEESEALLGKMLDAGWVGRIKADYPLHAQFGKRSAQRIDTWILLANPEQLKLADVYRLFVFNIDSDKPLARQVEAAIEQGLNQTLSMHFSPPKLALAG